MDFSLPNVSSLPTNHMSKVKFDGRFVDHRASLTTNFMSHTARFLCWTERIPPPPPINYHINAHTNNTTSVDVSSLDSKNVRKEDNRLKN